MPEKIEIELNVNGGAHRITVPPRLLLSDALRDECGLTGTHVGCEHGVCGACTVLIDGRPARACLTYAIQMEGHEITTIEGIGTGEGYSPLQQAMQDAHGLQCGFCTPGIVTTFEAYLQENPDPSDAEIRDVLSGNLCRCTGYENIVTAVRNAAAVMREKVE